MRPRTIVWWSTSSRRLEHWLRDNARGAPSRDHCGGRDAGRIPRSSVHVPLGDRAYDILVGRGLLAEAGARIAALGARAAAIVTDAHVGALYAGRLAESLQQQGLRTSVITVAAGEATKSYASLEQVCDAVLGARIERGDLVIALGGGVVGDLAGFAAAVMRRGVRFVQVPTSLLSQVDSSVGGKTGINSPPRQESRRCVPPAKPRPGRYGAARYAAASRDARGLCRGGEIRPHRRCRVSSTGARPIGAACSRAGPSATRPWRRAAAPRPPWWCATSARRATARFSISATPSATRSSASRATIPRGSSMARASPSACASRSASRLFSGSARGQDADACRTSSGLRRPADASAGCAGRFRRRRVRCSTPWRRTRR